MARYHLKDDGTAGPCQAAPGRCPKGNAIHGDSVEAVYEQLAVEMSEQVFPRKMFTPAPPRKTARAVGSEGAMMHYTDPEIIQEQVAALRKLGLLEEAMPTLAHYSPLLATAVQTGREDAIDYKKLYEKPHEYEYGHRDTDYGTEWYTGETMTWVGKAHYELQTVAQNALMDRLEKGTLAGADLQAYKVALGDTSKRSNAFLAFNYNPVRQPENFWNNVKNRLVEDGCFTERELAPGRTEIKISKFLWDGLDQGAKERMASTILLSKYASRGRSLQATMLSGKGYGSNFGSTMASAFAYNADLHGRGVLEGKPLTFDEGEIRGDASYPVVRGVYRLTSAGVEWQVTQQLFYSKKDRANGLHKDHRLNRFSSESLWR